MFSSVCILDQTRSKGHLGDVTSDLYMDAQSTRPGFLLSSSSPIWAHYF